MTPSAARSSSHRLSSLAVPWPVLLVAGLMVVGLLAVSGAYGFHGDEMYYVVAGQHPAFGYVDQPPLTPLLSAASVGLLGVSPTAVRVLPALEMALIVVLVALMARDLGGSRRAQVLAAVTAALSGYLAGGHIDSRASPTCSPGRSSCGCS
jgi:4-amino-4-deoxy-L-arabinose transferase-like glycosyltransferase